MSSRCVHGKREHRNEDPTRLRYEKTRALVARRKSICVERNVIAKPKVLVSEHRRVGWMNVRGTRRPVRASRRRSIGPFRILVFECVYAGTYNELSHVARWMRAYAAASPMHTLARRNRVRARALDRTDSSAYVRVVHASLCTRIRIHEPRKAQCHKGSAPSSIANIDLNHKDRPLYPIVGLRLIVCSLSRSLSPFLLYPQLSMCIARSAPSFFNGNDLSIHLFRTVYVPLVAFRPNAVVARCK